MASASTRYSKAISHFADELSKHEGGESARCQLSDSLYAQSSSTSLPKSINGQKMDSGMVDNGLCQMCKELGNSGQSAIYCGDTIERRYDHAQIHLKQQRLVTMEKIDVEQFLSRCFPKANIQPKYVDNVFDDRPQLHSLEQLLTNYGRGMRRKSSSKEAASKKPTARKKSVPRPSPSPSAPATTIRRKPVFKKQQDGKSLTKLAHYLFRKWSAVPGTNAIQCKLCRFSVDLQQSDVTPIKPNLEPMINARLTSVRLAEHSLEHIGRSLKYRCPLCEYKTTKYLAIWDHTTRVHELKMFSFRVNSISSDSAATDSLRRCFGEMEETTARPPIKEKVKVAKANSCSSSSSGTSDGGSGGSQIANSTGIDGPNQQMSNQLQNQLEPTVAKYGNNNYTNVMVEFLSRYCQKMDERVIPPDGNILCKVCDRTLRCRLYSKVIWDSLFVHAVRHVWRELYKCCYPQKSYRFALKKHPIEIGRMILRCFGPTSDGADETQTV